MLSYQALFDPDHEAGGFTVTFPDVPGCVTQGDDLAEAYDMAQDALETMLGYMIRHNEAIPAPRPRKGRGFRPVTLRPIASMKVHLYEAFRESGISKTELARRMGILKANVNRLFDLRHPSSFDQLETALRALGKRLVIQVEDAA
jgi:antitoxin HicB